MSLPELPKPGRVLQDVIDGVLRNATMLAIGLVGSAAAGSSVSAQVAEGAATPLIDLTSVDTTIRISVRYATNNNFVGAVVDGYSANRCLLTAAAAEALSAVQQELQPFGLSLIVYDCYRPQRAVDHFMRWAADPLDRRTKAEYYPTIAKADLIPEGYIAERSGHSRGSTVDLGLIDDSGAALPMGSSWDFFDPISHTEHANIDREAQANRLLLRSVMGLHGFSNYPKEWWHFTLDNEPYPDHYFDLLIDAATTQPGA